MIKKEWQDRLFRIEEKIDRQYRIDITLLSPVERKDMILDFLKKMTEDFSNEEKKDILKQAAEFRKLDECEQIKNYPEIPDNIKEDEKIRDDYFEKILAAELGKIEKEDAILFLDLQKDVL